MQTGQMALKFLFVLKRFVHCVAYPEEISTPLSHKLLSHGSRVEPRLHPQAVHEYDLGGTPHPVIVTIRDKKDYIRVLLYSNYTTITGWGGSSESITL